MTAACSSHADHQGPPAHPGDDLSDFLSEAIALAQRINRRLSERSAQPTSNAVELAISTPVEN